MCNIFTDRQTDRQAGRQAARQTDRHLYAHIGVAHLAKRQQNIYTHKVKFQLGHIIEGRIEQTNAHDLSTIGSPKRPGATSQY